MFQKRFNYSSGDDASNTIWADTTFLLALGFLALLLILVLHLNPKAKKTNDTTIPVVENVIIEVTWPPEFDIDVDTWVQAPGDVAVGYSNKGGVSCNLLRDDLGHQGDLTGINYENVRCRGILPGEYTVNVHLFRNTPGVYPVPVMVVVSSRPLGDDGSKDNTKVSKTKQILATKPKDLELQHYGEELTVFRFQLTEDGELVKGSVHAVFKQLRAVSSGLGEFDMEPRN